jgi:hypothetical protein
MIVAISVVGLMAAAVVASGAVWHSYRVQNMILAAIEEINAVQPREHRINPWGFAHPGTYFRIYDLHCGFFPDSDLRRRFWRGAVAHVILWATAGALWVASLIGLGVTNGRP